MSSVQRRYMNALRTTRIETDDVELRTNQLSKRRAR
jgi:hypothetical protein